MSKWVDLKTVSELKYPLLVNMAELGVDVASINLDDIRTTGFYKIAEKGATQKPGGQAMGCVVLHLNWNSSAAFQLFFQWSNFKIYGRQKLSGTWQGWKELQMS